MKIEFDSVTWYSKTISAIVLLGIVPILVFFIGREYQKTIVVLDQENAAAVKNVSSNTHVYSGRESGTSTPAQYSSGIRGIVMVGPTCPVIQAGSEEKCADKPLETALKFINQYGAVLTVTSAADGTFSISLPPGTYIVQQGGEGLLPSLSPQTVMVNEDQYTDVELSFDSGIR